MESDSDGEEEVFTGMQLPPLINQLKRILAEYPDGGQILKELIQNAEDAGATEFQLLYDQRCINHDTDRTKEYTKFFRGPALCVYNNALFQEEDWEGIRMIDMSVKESEPLKVGRFGLGFKSIFHLTDYPCVFSGDKLLLIDPQKERDKVNAMMKLDRLSRYKRMDIEAFYTALDGCFGINRDIMETGFFKGTLFWFPLRDTASKLSENIYNEDKIMTLLESIKQERQSLIIFLKSLTSINIEIKAQQGNRITYVSVEVENAQIVSKKRNSFRQSIDHLTKHDGDAVQCALEMKIKTSVLSDDKISWENSSLTWLIVNYFMGKNASTDFKRLIKDKELGLSPYVSIGAPYSGEQLEGHVFCFLPLPREDTSLTGLPVHINGFFALNQSRHHVKWSTEEQIGHELSDKNVLWNKYLISEALPIAYQYWFDEALQLAKLSSNDDDYVKTIHRAIPVSKNVQGKWKELLLPLFRTLKNTAILFSHNQKVWVSVNEALFLDKLVSVSDTCLQTVVNAVTQIGRNYVKLPNDLVDTFSDYFKFDKETNLLKPLLLSHMLRNDRNKRYRSLCDAEKFELTNFLMHNNNYSNLQGLELLPLASGRWETFQSYRTDSVYMCDKEEFELFPGMDDKILLQESKFPAGIYRHFEIMSKCGKFQLKVIDEQSELETMLQGVIDKYLPRNQILTKTSTKCNLNWLKNVWTYLSKESKVSVCKSIPLIPVLIHGTWNNPEVELIRATKMLILKEQKEKRLQDEIVYCLKALSIVVVPSLPVWLPFGCVESYIYVPSSESVVKILTHMQHNCSSNELKQIVTSFNNTERLWRKMFMEFICDTIKIQPSCIRLLKDFRMFESVKSPGGKCEMLSITANNLFLKTNNFPAPFPICLPATFINGYGNSSTMLISLGAEQVKNEKLFIMTLKAIIDGKYSEKDSTVFVRYLVENFTLITKSCSEMNKSLLIQYSSCVPFIQTRTGLKKPSDLFNPTDNTLQDLFKDECVFPGDDFKDKEIRTLLDFGLKTQENVRAEDMVTSARLLDKWSRNRTNNEGAALKSKAMVEIITIYPELLEDYFEGRSLNQHLFDLEILSPKKERPESYPHWYPWYSPSNLLCKPSQVKSIKLVNLVGSVMPIVDHIPEQVSRTFSLESSIPTNMLIMQHQTIKQNYQAKYKPDLLGYLQKLYRWLGVHSENHAGWEGIEIIWEGNQFCKPKEVTACRQEDDINLEPFFFSVPDEFEEFSEMFKSLGCKRKQSIDVLMETLSKIKKSNDSSHCSLVVRILRRLAENIHTFSTEARKEILIPVHSENQNRLEFKRLDDCTYTEDPDDFISDEDDETGEDILYFVHRSVSAGIATTLGIRSLQRRQLIYTEEITVDEWGQQEPLTTRLKTLIEEGYVDGLSVPKELLQNADDAGATSLKFLYDERENQDAMHSLLNQGMKACHGPSLWVYNDAKFSDEDFVNITKLNAATKKKNMQTIGKFGLGFCSVYNLTDVPSIVSGSNIVIFDPHKSHLRDTLSGSSPGLKIDLKRKGNMKLLKRNKDQFKPYNGVFDCDLSSKTPFYEGTLFRLPLRTVEESKVSEIKTEPYSQRDVLELLALFMKNAINLLLFMQNIQTIEVYHLQSSAVSTEQKELLFRVCRKSVQCHGSKFISEHKSVLSQFTSNKNALSTIQRLDMLFEVFNPIQSIKPKLDIKPTRLQSCWLLSWATGTKESRALLQDPHFESSLPLAAVAVPLHDDNSGPKYLSKIGIGSFTSGRLYCFLPIPCDILLPWHLHGCFEVTSDRRQLKLITEQDKSLHRNNWNEYLLQDACVHAFLLLLEHLTRISPMDDYTFYELWPMKTIDVMKPFVRSFFKSIVMENIKIFKSKNGWFCFKDIAVLDPYVRHNKIIGEIAFKMLQHFPVRASHNIIDLPHQALEALKVNNDKEIIKLIDSKIVKSEDMLKVFFMNISSSFWDNFATERNEVVKFAIKNRTESVKKLLESSQCIPCINQTDLKRPNELIDPLSTVGSMFCDADSMFPTPDFRKEPFLGALLEYGMISHSLPIGMLLQRIQSIEHLAQECTVCAKERIKSILCYLNQLNNIEEVYSEDNFSSISNTFWLPVLQRPTEWKFSWFADNQKYIRIFPTICCYFHKGSKITLTLGQTCKLYENKDIDFIGCVSNVIDETNGNSQVWRKLGIRNVKSQKGFEDVVDQLVILSNEYDPKLKYNAYCKLYRRNIKFLQSLIEQNEECAHMLMLKLGQNRVVLINDEMLVQPSHVAFEVTEPCYPFLCRLPEQDQQYPGFFKAIGVAERFTVERIINVLSEKSKVKQGLSENDINQLIKILENLVDFFERNKTSYMDYKEYHNVIVGPDQHGNVSPTYELASDDQMFNSKVQMKIIHDAFPRSLAKKLGVKSKQLKCLEHISFGIPWGQKEKLETRIQGLLKDYPCDDSILKELIQNADDANAKELHFIMDFRKHSVNTIIGKGNLQKPALCVYNDGYFSEKDLLGITNLGIGSKQKDASKTGQFGVGFNAVYHLTDTPSFLTKGPELNSGVLCMLDPLRCDIPVDESNPGLRFSVNEVEENFPNSLSGFLEKHDGFFDSGKGTMFRFPLRREASALSKHTVTVPELSSMLNTFSENMLDILLFVKSVETIQISSIKEGQLVHEYSLKIKISEEDRSKREQFFRTVKAVCNRNRDVPLNNLKEDQLHVHYLVEVRDSKDSIAKWLIFQTFGCIHKDLIKKNIVEAFNDNNLGHLPLGGIAVPYIDFHQPFEEPKVDNASFSVKGIMSAVSSSFSSLRSKFINEPMQSYVKHCQGRLFAFLPLPVKTGFKLHINANFSLDHSRRDVWKEGYRYEWNTFLGGQTVVVSWINALKHLQKHFNQTSLFENNVCSQKHIMEMICEYHSLFPVLDNLHHSFSKELVEQFYSTIYKKEESLFPMVTFENGQSFSFSVTWVPLKTNGKTFGAVFKDKTDEEVDKLHTVLKRLGMILVETPKTIYKSLVELGYGDVTLLNPEFVIDFLHTFQSKEPGSCNIGNLNTMIAATQFLNKECLACVVKYICKTESFLSKVENLPVLLTGDKKLHVIDKESKVFHSRFCNLLPSSKSMFVHLDFLNLFIEDVYFTEGLLQKLDIDSFQTLLQNESIDQYKGDTPVDWNKADKQLLISSEWIHDFFSFIQENSSNDESSSFAQNIFKFSDLCVLPAICTTTHGKTNQLLPIALSYTLFYDNKVKYSVAQAVMKLCLPQLDESPFTIGVVKEKIISILPNTSTPNELLKCLHYYKQSIANSGLTAEEAHNVLSYFNHHVDELKLYQESQLFLKELPLHLTSDNKLVCINAQETLILSCKIPYQGIREWASKVNKIVLKADAELVNLYKYLCLTGIDVVQFYADVFVPTISSLPQQHWYIQLNVMKGLIFKDNEISKKLLKKLQNLRLFEIGQQMKKACELYWHENEVFKELVNENEFPPNEYRNYEWKSFCKALKMNFDVTDELLIRFAKTIESNGQRHINEVVKRQASVLYDHLCNESGKWKKETLYNIRHIKFVCPYTIDNNLRYIHDQPDSCSTLIALSQSISADSRLLCWSSMNMISDIPFDSRTVKLLDICNEPPVENVILHCQNIFTSLQEKLNQRRTVLHLEEITENIYTYFQRKNNNDMHAVVNRLERFPFIHIPKYNILVKCKAVVIEMDTSHEILPYLYKAPTYYGKYFELFKQMGSKETLEISHCAFVLNEIKQKVAEKVMMHEELAVAKKVLRHLIMILQNSKSEIALTETLFLPNRNCILTDSRCLTVSDRQYYEKKLIGKVPIDYFLDFAALEIKVDDQVRIFHKLPKNVRPIILSELLKEVYIEDCFEVVENCPKAMKIEGFLHSNGFIEGFLRLYKHDKTQKNLPFDHQKCATEIARKIRTIKVVSIFNLKSFLSFKGCITEGTDMQRKYHIKNEESDKCAFFISETGNNSPNWIMFLTDGIKNLLRYCTGCEIDWTLLHCLTFNIDSQSVINDELDIQGIDNYNLPQQLVRSVFPKPGQYVEEHFLPFLEPAIIPFKEEEYPYVAMELEEPVLRDDSVEGTKTSDYIYVNIIKEIDIMPNSSDLLRIYLVNTGNRSISNHEHVPIYQLYRFVRQHDTTADVIEYDTEPICTIPFDDTCRRIRDMLQEAWHLPQTDRKRIIRRLLLRWHPDKNPGKEGYCKDIFNYIQSAIILLEQGQQISSVIDRRTYSNEPNMSSSAYNDLVRNVTRQASSHARAYHDNIAEYNRSSRTGQYSHVSNKKTSRPDISEAQRWMRQAKTDFKTAKAFGNTTEATEGHNWICYTCHQACEKALRAAHFSKDANDVPANTHYLNRLALSFSSEIKNQVSEIERQLRDHNRMRYPNSVSRPNIPSDLYTEDDAKFALEKTKELINTIENEFDLH